MGQHWLSGHAVLWAIMYSFPTIVGASPCAKIVTQSAVVAVGSTVTASCHIRDDCPLTKDPDFLVQWNHGGVLISRKAGQDPSAYEIAISNFTDMKAELVCQICTRVDCNIVDALEIKAAYPPAAPRNLTCQLNLTEPFMMLCKWDPGQQTSDIPTNYTLHTTISDSPQKFIYTPAPGQHFFKVPRNGFAIFNKVQVYVLAVNAMGQATSETLLLDPLETAKLGAPQIQVVGTEKHGCLQHHWSLSEKQKWITRTLYIEMKLTPVNKKISDKEQVIFRKARPSHIAEVCGLLHGMIYNSKMRVKYHNGPWSEWSHPILATTPMKAPVGRLVAWLKLSGPSANPHHTAQLCWKPSSQFRPNSMNVSYIVLLWRPPNRRVKVCETDQQHCSFQIPAGVRKVYLTAMNKAGKSSDTEVAVYRRKGERHSVPNLQVHSQSEESVLVEWSSPESSAVTGCVLEWKMLNNEIVAPISFEIMDKNQTSFVVSALEPYQPYEFSLYPKYKDGIGQSYDVMAYTKEKAPSEPPNLKFRKITPSSVELEWDEIPLQRRNGIIIGYKIFYWDEYNSTRVMDTTGTDRNVVLKPLHPLSAYSILLMTSTNGGSLNGSVVTVKTPSIDAFEIVLIVIPACVGLTLLFLGVFTCVSNQKCLKKFMWPMIPDPANSSIKKWTMTGSLQDLPAFKEVKDPMLVYLSHFSLLSLSEKELWKADKNLKSGKWPYDGTDVEEDPINPSHNSGTCSSSGHQSESVSYATVVFSSPYRSQPAAPPAYLRSESTQPLLADEEPVSPTPYEKMIAQGNQANSSKVETFSAFLGDLRSIKETSSIWEDFPMLNSLEIENSQDQA